MTRLEDRQTLMRDIAQARAEGARLAPACALAGIDRPHAAALEDHGDCAVIAGRTRIALSRRTR